MTGIAAGVIDRLGVRLRQAGPGANPRALLGLALRRNPRRAQLLVSRVLGKHVPTDPRLVRSAGLLLGGLVADALADRPPRELPVSLLHAAVDGDRTAIAALHVAVQAAIEEPPDALVLGFAETATALGHCVAEGLGGADVLHSTRRPVPGFAMAGGFTEEHSHATDHLLLPADAGLLGGGRPLVLVDDEQSTGRTALNTITTLHRAAPRERYVVAALVDVRPPGEELAAGVAALGARLDVVALARGAVDLPPDIAERAAALRAELDARLTGTESATRVHPDPDSRRLGPAPSRESRFECMRVALLVQVSRGGAPVVDNSGSGAAGWRRWAGCWSRGRARARGGAGRSRAARRLCGVRRARAPVVSAVPRGDRAVDAAVPAWWA